jgi:NADPH-dependent 2,4-dienoyl-CoA reductase/sulfur reductase-like enzyme
MSSVVVVGAGQAGARCAEALRALGHAGAITLIGDEPEDPYERPSLSKSLLAGTTTVGDARVLPPGWYAANHVSLRLATTVVSVEPSTRRVNLRSGEAMPYDALVFATGGRPRVLADGQSVLRTVADAIALRGRLQQGSRLIIIGAGLIGLEVAATARALGVQVTIVETASTPMARAVPASVGRWFIRLHESHGVDWRLGVRVASADLNSVTLASGETLAGESVLCAIGVVPNDDLPRTAGLPTDDGVLVDQCGRTADASIYAVGDCARLLHPHVDRAVRLESWQHAQVHAQCVARTLIGQPEPYVEVPWAWSDQYDVNLQVCGWPRPDATEVWRGDPDHGGATLFQVVPRDDGRLTLCAAVSINRRRDQPSAKRLIARGASVDPAALADPAVRLG